MGKPDDTAKTKPGFVEFLRRSPLKGADLRIQRDTSPVRPSLELDDLPPEKGRDVESPKSPK